MIQLITGRRNISSDAPPQKETDDILRHFDRDAKLRRKKEFIRKFIEENLPRLSKNNDVEKAFEEFWTSERATVLKDIAKAENIPQKKFEKMISEYLYTQKLPRGQDIVDAVSRQLACWPAPGGGTHIFSSDKRQGCAFAV